MTRVWNVLIRNILQSGRVYAVFDVLLLHLLKVCLKYKVCEFMGN